MKTKRSDLITIILFCAFLFSMVVLYLFLPKTDFSETEKRYLEEFPSLTWEGLSSGDWGNDIETYMADHIPGRNFFVGLNAYFDLFTGRQVSKDIQVAEDRLIEAPVSRNQNAVAKNLKAIQSFAETLGRNIHLMLIPSAGWSAGIDGYEDDEIIKEIYAISGEKLETIDMLSVFEGKPDLYYKTDHHWNSAGAYAAYQAYMSRLGREFKTEEEFTKTVPAQFQGSTYSRSALWLTKAEDLELWLGSENLTVENGESEGLHDGVFYWDRLEEADKYTVFLDGNHSVVRIHNPDAEGKLLVIRDSYSNSLGCFLAESYEEVVLIDLRYYKQPVSELAAQENFNDILVCYSIGNFLTDTNLIWLR